MRIRSHFQSHNATIRAAATGGALVLVMVLAWLTLAAPAPSAQTQVTLLSASFDIGVDGFVYGGDAFGTSQPGYASGAWVPDGFGGTGGLQVTLGGLDANLITDMSGGWSTTLNPAADETGVTLSFRYKLDQSATYEYDEYTEMLVTVDGVQYGRGSKNYVDHIGGDGSSSLGNSSTFLPTTDWQQHQIFLGNLAAGPHTIVLGGYNNKKDAADESSTITIDEVLVTSGNSAPAITDRQAIVNRLNGTQFANNLQGLTSFGDRCRLSSCPGSPANSFLDAQAWVASQLTVMGYSVQYHTSALNGGVSNLYVTKLGAVNPDQMYIVSGHLDGRGGGAAYDDDGSGAALVLTAAQVFAGSDVQTDSSVRFIWWDKEEAGLFGSNAYVQERGPLQGSPGEPTWLGVIQHDMILFDHGAGTASASQSPYADLDVEWRAGTAAASLSRALALKWRFLNGTYSTQYPATAYDFSTNTDDTSFHQYVASISVRENRRNLTSGSNAEWVNPNYHTANDVASSYSALDLNLGFNAVQGTVGTVAELVNAHLLANRPPTANAQSVTTAEGVAVTVTLTGSDPDGNPLTYSVVSAPVNGSLSGTAPTLTYNPAAGYVGADSFSFKVNDGAVDSASATVSIAVASVVTATSTMVSSSQNPSVYGQSIGFTSTTTSSGGVPVGTVTFTEGATVLASSMVVDGSGHASFSATALAVGSHTITASFTGSSGWSNSSGNAAPQVVNKAATTTAISSSANPSVYSQPVTLTATVTATAPVGGAPTGTVTFKKGSTTLGSGTLDGNGRATFTTSTLAVGSASITANYGGSTSFNASSSSTLSQMVNQDGTTSTVTSSLNPSVRRQSVTFTATVAAIAPGTATPTGTVTFKDGSKSLSSRSLNASGQASFTISSLSTGTHQITAVYGGSSSFLARTSTVLVQTVH